MTSHTAVLLQPNDVWVYTTPTYATLHVALITICLLILSECYSNICMGVQHSYLIYSCYRIARKFARRFTAKNARGVLNTSVTTFYMHMQFNPQIKICQTFFSVCTYVWHYRTTLPNLNLLIVL